MNEREEARPKKGGKDNKTKNTYSWEHSPNKRRLRPRGKKGKSAIATLRTHCSKQGNKHCDTLQHTL